MSRLEEFTDSLAQETMIEMAESFFGARKSIDDERELFEDKVKAIASIADAALAKLNLLHALLLEEGLAHELYAELGVRPGRLFQWVDPAKVTLFLDIPFALTGEGRYVRLVCKTYDAVQQAFDEYLHGRYYADPRTPGRKRLSLHFELLKDWAGHINRRIRNVNEGMAPSCVLGFFKGLHPGEVDNERITGATIPGYSCALDDDLAIPPVDCLALGLKEFPELPPAEAVKPRVERFAHALYPDNKERINALLERLTR